MSPLNLFSRPNTPMLSQLLLTGFMFPVLHQLCYLSLDTLHCHAGSALCGDAADFGHFTSLEKLLEVEQRTSAFLVARAGKQNRRM